MATKILSAEQIRLVDAYTIRHEPVSSEDLMERAATACLKIMLGHIGFLKTVHVFCGPGNNGGDGFVIARLLKQKQFDVHTWLVPFRELSPECVAKKQLVPDCVELTDESELPELTSGVVIIDALLGVGTSRAPKGLLQSVIGLINESGAKVLSVDIPSGLPADSIPDWEPVVRAAYTVTFQYPKLTFFLKETAAFCGEWTVVDIGLDQQESARQQSRYFHLCAAEKLVRRRERFTRLADCREQREDGRGRAQLESCFAQRYRSAHRSCSVRRD
jgi:NAD(P)H-hydrate epimerase